MSVKLRCERCFAPKDHEDGVCEFCGLDPMEEKAIAKLGDELMEEFLKELEEEGGKTYVKEVSAPDDQLNMLDLRAQQLQSALEAITVETLTPIEAMNELYKLKKMLN